MAECLAVSGAVLLEGSSGIPRAELWPVEGLLPAPRPVGQVGLRTRRGEAM